jgi:hypothetical protein
MIAVNDKIVVRVDMKQKNCVKVGDTVLKTVHDFGTNYRERSPVVGEIVQGNDYVHPGQLAIFHHNHFYPPSPYYLYDDLYSVPFNKTVFGVLDGTDIRPMCGNIIGKRVQKSYDLEMPTDLKELYIDRLVVDHPGWTSYKKGQTLIIRPNSYYEIVYSVNNVVYKVHKTHEDWVVAYIK